MIATSEANRDGYADREDEGEWGWIGLRGLVGLAGLRRRDRDDVAHRSPASSTR